MGKLADVEARQRVVWIGGADQSEKRLPLHRRFLPALTRGLERGGEIDHLLHRPRIIAREGVIGGAEQHRVRVAGAVSQQIAQPAFELRAGADGAAFVRPFQSVAESKPADGEAGREPALQQ